MSITINYPSYDGIYELQAWHDNNIRLVLTQGEGLTVSNGTVAHVKAPKFQLKDERGVIDLTSCNVSLALTRPDGSEDLLACSSASGEAVQGIISCPITASATEIAGDAIGEIRVLSNNGVLKFYGVHFKIYKGVSDNAAAQSTQFSDLIRALQKVVVIDPDGSNTITMDDVIRQNGTNPVASGIIYDALVLKANATDVDTKTMAQFKYGSHLIMTFDSNGILLNSSNNTSLSAGAYNDPNIGYAFIPSRVVSIDGGAFTSGCTGLTDVYVDKESGDWLSGSAFPSGVTIHYRGSFDMDELLAKAIKYLNTKEIGASLISNSAIITDKIADGAVTVSKLSTSLKTTIDNKANTSDVNTALVNKADKATTLSGYGITDAYTKNETDKRFELRQSIGFDANGVPIVRWDVSSFSDVTITDTERIVTLFLASKVTTIPSGKFYYCSNLTKIYIDKEQSECSGFQGGAFPSEFTSSSDQTHVIYYKGNFNANAFAFRALKWINDNTYRKSEVDSAISIALANKADNATTLAGYGITDAYTKARTDAMLDNKVNNSDFAQYQSTVYTKQEIDGAYFFNRVAFDLSNGELKLLSGSTLRGRANLGDFTYKKQDLDIALNSKAEKSTIDSITENLDFFVLNSQTVGGVTVTNNGDGSYTFNGASTGIVLFPAFTIPAGDYTAHIGAVSGTADAQGAIRYGTGSGELWISTNHTEESQSFESPTPVFFRLNTGTYTNWRLRIRVEKDGYVSAVDGVARDGLEEVSERVSVLDVISERNNYFSLDTQTVSGISAAKLSEDTFEFSGTNSDSAAFPEFYVPAGTYSAKIEAVSGTATARAGIRYGEGNGTSWVTDGTAQPVQLTFNARTRIFFRLNIGEYSAWRLKISITNAAAEYTAIDYKMREKSAEDDLRAAALAETVAGLELPVNHLSAYNAFTCVDKTKVKLTAATNILAFGDSITHGGSWGTPWVTYLSNIVGCTVNNYAVSGALFGESVRTSDKWISSQISAVTAADWSAATLVIVAAGTNDAGYSTTDSELATKVQAAITAIKAQTNAPILFITPIKRGSTDADANYAKLPKISGIIENVALKNQCSVICGLDFPIPAHDSGAIENMMGEAGGYIHPNNTGGYVYAMCVINAVM